MQWEKLGTIGLANVEKIKGGLISVGMNTTNNLNEKNHCHE